MPIALSGRVLVTGANGYVALQIVDHLLKQGYLVRATVRSAAKGAPLSELFTAYGDKLQIVVIEDMTVDGAFDKAVQDIDAVMHVASPVVFISGPPAEIIEPAVRGTVGLLKSVSAYGSSVKRIVVTSSLGAVATFSVTRCYNETDWNDAAVKECEDNGSNASPMMKYCASKVLAERAAWKFFKEQKVGCAWDLTVIIPPYVFGPLLDPDVQFENFGGSMRQWYDAVFKPGEIDQQIVDGFYWIDVRDLADAHIKAINTPSASGERIIVAAGHFNWKDWPISARKLTDKTVAVDSSYDLSKIPPQFTYDLGKMENILGRAGMRSKEDTTVDIIKDFAARGWIN